MSGRICVYAGSFDPITRGHMWVISQGALIFDELIVAVGVNANKTPMFSTADRTEMIKRSTIDLSNVRADSFDLRYLVDYAQSVCAIHILRGIRSLADYEAEKGMRDINGLRAPRITTIFLMPPAELANISSSMVKGLVGPAGWEDFLRNFVDPYVLEKLKEEYLARHPERALA